MSALSSGASQQALPLEHYIDTLLSHKGLPYQQAAKNAIRSHLSDLLREYPSLQVKIEVFSHGDGGSASSLLLQLFGTIPIFFSQVIYSIPTVIWLSDQYPFRAPTVSVVPSPSMVIRPSHPLVGPSGLVSCARLHTWVYPVSNLAELVRSLCTAFGQDPPLYSISCFSDGNTSMSAPSSCSSSADLAALALPTSSSPTLGLNSLLRQSSPAVTGTAGLGHPGSRPLPSASLSCPGSSLQRRPSYGLRHGAPPLMGSLFAESRPLTQQHLSYNSGASMIHQQFSASFASASAGSPDFFPELRQYAADHHDGETSMPRSSSFIPSTALLIRPGKFSQWHSLLDAGRSSMDHSQAALQSAGLLKRPNGSAQGEWHPAVALADKGSSMIPTLNLGSLPGPGKSPIPISLHDSKHSMNYTYFPPESLHNSKHSMTHPPSPPVSLFGSGFLLQRHPPQSMTHMSLTSALSLESMPGNGIVSQCYSSHPQMGVSVVPPLSTAAVPAAVNSAACVPRMQSQHIDIRECQNTAVLSTDNNEDKPRGSLLTSALLPMPHQMSSSLALAQHQIQLPTVFSNPLHDDGKDQPCDRRHSFMNELIERLQHDIGEIRMVKEKDMLKLMDMECLLKRRQALFKDCVGKLQQQEEDLEVQLQNVLVNTELLEAWLLSNNKNNVEIYVDDIFEPRDGLSKQLLECTASDLAIEDAMYCLDRSAYEGMLSLDSYLKLVRTLCREQFFQRALAVKVRVAQEQS